MAHNVWTWQERDNLALRDNNAQNFLILTTKKRSYWKQLLFMPQECYTKYDNQCHKFEFSCSILIVKHGIVSPTLNVNPTLFVIPCEFFEGLYIFHVAITITYQVIVHPNFNHP